MRNEPQHEYRKHRSVRVCVVLGFACAAYPNTETDTWVPACWRVGTAFEQEQKPSNGERGRCEIHIVEAMSASVYIESSVVSYLTSRPSRDTVIAGRQAITVAWWQGARSRYEVFVSILVMEEISAGNPEAVARRLSAVAEMSSLGISREAYVLADALLSTKAVPQNSQRDALHIAIAATQGMDFLLTWNFRHINNAETRRLIAKTTSARGFVCPVLCSPEELGGIDDDE